MSPTSVRVGERAADVESPALVIDLDAMERNLAAMAAFARERRVRLRPHAKMHKSAVLARAQMAAGAVGVCVQKLSEAEALAGAGVPDIFITNEVIAPSKLARLAELARQVRLAVAVDSALGVERLARALQRARSSADVFVEIDVGQGRCGVAPAAAGALAQQVVAQGQADGGMRLAGLQAYHGGAQHLRSAAEREAAVRQAVARVRAAQASITRAGMSCPLVSGAGTGTFEFEAASGVYGELQAGSYLFMDRDYADNQPGADASAPRFEHALFVKSQVVSRGVSHAVVDAGHKAHAIDSGPPRIWCSEGDASRTAGRPDESVVRGRFAAGLVFANGGDEHGIVRTIDAAAALPELGDTVWLVPGHCDPTVNLHDRYVAVRGGLAHGVVEALWPIDARGCLV
ncbi:MAG: DSD1 family PLP-dependent enzyme [Burkholderiaceae bacterium]